MSLTNLGLTTQQERLCRRLLRDPEAEVAGGPVLGELRALSSVDGALTAVPPADAGDLLVRRRTEQTRHQLTELTPGLDVLTERPSVLFICCGHDASPGTVQDPAAGGLTLPAVVSPDR